MYNIMYNRNMNKKASTTHTHTQRCDISFLSLRRFWRLPRNCKAISRNDKICGNFGFTLIELLVVVLIIAILAAIALPKYKLTVERTHATEAYVTIKALVEAAERYKLATGNYPTINIWSSLDIELPTTTTDGSNAVTNNWTYVLSSGDKIRAYRGIGHYLLDGIYTSSSSSHAGEYYCLVYLTQSDSDFYKKVCASFCGVQPTDSGNYSTCYKV